MWHHQRIYEYDRELYVSFGFEVTSIIGAYSIILQLPSSGSYHSRTMIAVSTTSTDAYALWYDAQLGKISSIIPIPAGRYLVVSR